MLQAILQRYKGTQGRTLGEFRCRDLLLFSLERPWKNNSRNVSSIPYGNYRCDYTYSPRFKKHLYLLRNVPGRDGIRIHSANLPEELMGCIALGLQIGVLEGEVGILKSDAAMAKLERFMDLESFMLEVRDV